MVYESIYWVHTSIYSVTHFIFPISSWVAYMMACTFPSSNAISADILEEDYFIIIYWLSRDCQRFKGFEINKGKSCISEYTALLENPMTKALWSSGSAKTQLQEMHGSDHPSITHDRWENIDLLLWSSQLHFACSAALDIFLAIGNNWGSGFQWPWQPMNYCWICA